MELTGENCCHSCSCDSQALSDEQKNDMMDELCQCPHPELSKNDMLDEICQCPHPELSKNLKEIHLSTEESGLVQSKESTMELPEENDCNSCACEPESTTPIPVKPPRREKNHVIEESKPVLALTQPTWASIAEKTKPNLENEPELPTATDVIPLKTKKVSTIVIAVDDLKAPATVKEVDEGFRVIRAKRESKICVEETKCISEEENKISSSTEENREDILKNEETHKLESLVNNVTIEASQTSGVLTNIKTCASNTEKAESNLESELLTPTDLPPFETQTVSNANDDDVVTQYNEELLVLKSKIESKIQYAEDTLSRSFSEQDNETKNKVHITENAVAENEAVNTHSSSTEYNADIEENSGEIEEQIKKVLEEGAGIIEYYQVVENYLDIPILAEKDCDTVIESSNFNAVYLKDTESERVKEEAKRVLPPTSPTMVSIEEKPKSNDNEKTTNELEPITLAPVKEQTKQCKDITSEFPVTSYVLPLQSEERDLAIKAPTWASVAEKPKQNCATDHEFLSPSDVIPLPAHKLSTIVVAVEDDKAQEVGKEQDNEGFTVVKTKRESKICMETEEEHSKILDVNNDIQTDVPVDDDTVASATIRNEEARHEENVKVTDESVIYIETKAAESTDQTADVPILPLAAPTWAYIAEKPKQSVEIETELPTPAGIIPLQAHKLSTVIVAVEDDKTPREDQDDEGFTVVKTKRESKILDIHNDIQIEVHVNKDTVASENSTTKECDTEMDVSNEENAKVTDEAVLHVEPSTSDSFAETPNHNLELDPELPASSVIQLQAETCDTDNEVNRSTAEANSTADDPILALAAPTWAYIAEKPKQSLEIETELPTPAGIIPLQAHKLSTIVVAVGDDQAHTEDQDDEGFTVVKTKRDSKIIVDTEKEKDINYISKDDQETTPCIEKNISLDTVIDNVESIDVEYDNTTDISMSNGLEKESSKVLDSLENVLSRKSESRISMKKRKKKNSIKSNEKLPDLVDSVEVVDLESNRKSREVFDFYADAIDGDTTMMESQAPAQNGVQNKTVASEQPKCDEQIVIENILNSIPRNMTNGNRFKDNSRQTENENRVSENGKGATEVEDTDLNGMEEHDITKFSSNHTSGANTLKRNWKRQNSKKKRRSSHIL
eukprot:GFUD01009290.1.p1 GENE.GFUD01009290.1~~GFUD01009290.1.p1  ORF type:complete len:1209 (-),score=356.56 GFUD01009290.1:118-3516(-)